MCDKRFLDELKKLVDSDSGYASYFDGATKEEGERFVVSELMIALGEIGFEVHSNQNEDGHPQDPPDCLVKLADGSLLGVEVTQILDGKMREKHVFRRAKEQRAGISPLDAFRAAIQDQPLVDAVHPLASRSGLL